MHWRGGLAAILVISALAGCADGVSSQGQAGYPPYSPENYGNTRDSGGVDSGSGGM